MSASQSSPKQAYINVMETLVAEAVEQQLQKLPPRVLKYIKRNEVETYALNRLPALYASSERGWQCQYDRAKHDYGTKIQQAVKQAFAAVQVDPIRLSQPLPVQSADPEAQKTLAILRDLLKDPTLEWQTLVPRLKQLLGQSLSQRSGSGNTSEHRSSWRPGTYGGEVAWQPKKPSASNPHRKFDWDDAIHRR